MISDIPLKNKVAVFDVDGTLLKNDSLISSIMVSNNIFTNVFKFFLSLPYLILWFLKIIDDKFFKEKIINLFNLCKFFNELNPEDKKKWLEKYLINNLNQKALLRLEKHKKNGDKVILCTASTRMHIEPLAEYLNVDLICTELKRANGLWKPCIKGFNCKGIEKVSKLKKYLKKNNNYLIEVYGDSKGDKELLQYADIPHFRNFESKPINYPEFSLNKVFPVIAVTLLFYGIIGIFNNNVNLFSTIKVLFQPIILGLIIISLSYCIRFYRWILILNKFKIFLPIKENFLIWMSSFAFTATPGKSGEALRSIKLKKIFKIPIFKSLLALIFERLTDGLSVLVLISINIEFISRFKLFFFLPVSFLITILLIALTSKKFTFEIFKRLLVKYNNSFFNKNKKYFREIKEFIDPKFIFTIVSIASFSWFLEGFSFWIILNAMTPKSINILNATIAHTASGLLGAISFMPGGLGAQEISTISLLTIQNIPIEIATTSTLIIRLMTLWFATALGIISYVVPLKIKEKKTFYD